MLKRNLLVTSSFLLLILMAFSSVKPSNTEEVQMGTYSISLNVKDISKSKMFYQNLGFEMLEGIGGIEQNWIILSNGEAKIGLFQGLFPNNTITFNPTDARSIYSHVKTKGIVPTFEMGFDKGVGPCTFSIADPDGNPILIDQH